MQQARKQEQRYFDLRGWRTLKHWYKSSEGRQCAAVEARALSGVLPSLFGAYIVMLGMPMPSNVLDDSPIKRRYQLELPYAEPNAAIDALTEFEHLPIANQLIDVMVLPHVLEFSLRPRTILDEAHRVLTDDGHVAILGFNPLALIHMWRQLALSFGKQEPAYTLTASHFLSASTVQAWLTAIGFELVSLNYYQGLPGAQFWSGKSTYLILVKKRTQTLTMIRPRWRSQRLSNTGLPHRT